MPKKKAKKTVKKKLVKKKVSKPKKTKNKKTVKKKVKRTKISRKAIESQIKRAIKKIDKPKKEVKRRKVDLLDIDQRPSNKIIIFDTNFLMIPNEFKVDIFTQAKKVIHARKVDFMIFDKTIYELQKLSVGSSKAAISARVGLQLINKNSVDIITSKDDVYVDDMLVNYAEYLPDFKGEVIIATQDKEFKGKLKKNGIKTLIMANKSKLAMK